MELTKYKFMMTAMRKVELYGLAIVCLAVGSIAGWYAGRATMASDITQGDMSLEVKTAMPPKPMMKEE